MFRRRRQEENDIAEELRAHLEIEIAQLMAAGATREQAELEARRKFGSPALVMEVSLDARRFVWLERLWQDVRYAAGILRRSPGFTAAVAFSLALGIGASTAVFSIADTVYLRPLPYSHPEQLAFVGIHFPYMAAEIMPSPDYVAWRRDDQSFQQMAATQGAYTMLLSGGDPMEVHVARVSANFLSTFAIAPALGRDFLPSDELPDGALEVLLTDRFWREHFQGRRDIAGRPMILDGQGYTVAGILPARFVFPMDVKVDALTTLHISPNASHRDRTMAALSVYGRLKPGVSLARAQANVETLLRTTSADFPRMFRTGTRPVVQSLQRHRVGNPGLVIRLLIGAVACLLLIACANVANLLLSRWSARSRELAVRAAIGATRGRLVRQLFTETALVTSLGCLLGLVLVAAALRAFVHFSAGELPRLAEVALDGRVLALALAVSVLTSIVFSALPVLRAGRMDIQTVLQQAGRRSVTGGHRMLRRGLVAVEVALSVILLSGAGLLLQSLWRLQRDHLGFLPEHAITITIPAGRVSISATERAALANEILEAVRQIPGTEAGAVTQCTPLYSEAGTRVFARSDRPRYGIGDNIAICGVGPDYFRAAGTRLIEGRAPAPEDYLHPGTVAVLNEAAVRTYFPGENPLGKQILDPENWKTVIGVVADTRNHGLGQPAFPQVFVNDTSPGSGPFGLMFLARTVADEAALASEVRGELRAHHPGTLAKIESLDQVISEATASPRFNSLLLASFAAVALLMAVVGVYGVLAFSVTERTREIGIRMALGASPGSVLASVLREGMLLTAIGSAAGFGAAMLLTKFLKSLLYGVAPRDPATMAFAIAVLCVTALTASALPARRAASVDPLEALRCE